MGGDLDGDAGPLFTPACSVHCYYNGGGNPPPTHIYTDATCWCPGERLTGVISPPISAPVGQKKDTADGGRGAAGKRGEGLSGLRKTARDGYLLQIYGECLDGGGR